MVGNNFGYGMMGGYGNGGMPYGYFGVLGLLIWILIIALIVASIVWLSRRSEGNSIAILKNRYAKGEISKKQFDEMKKELT